ncbi:MAG: hypothetical protein Q4G68_13115 [Planctomycetia bacterium]|nr:hypothetical protein [Planctomycetia bacterium]
MAINVICPGCMTRFQVSDRFAGKKGPCPKCGHIIEIPKEKLVVHAPEDITSGGKTFKGGSSIRPILQSRFVFSVRQLSIALTGVVLVLALAWSMSLWPASLAKNITGMVGCTAVGFCLVAFGYMMVREEDDLEILLGHELHRRSLYTAVCFALSWLALEGIISYMSPGPFVVIYLVPIAILGAAAAVIIFDTDVNKAGLLYAFFLIAVVILRGLMFAPEGWIWQDSVSVRPVRSAPVEVAPAEASPTDAQQGSTAGKSAPGQREKAEKPRVKLDPRSAPDPSKNLRR